jgi:DNA-binding MarR family transcriptional regulator
MKKQDGEDLAAVGSLFLQLYERYNRLESKRVYYKDLLEELTMIEMNTIVVIGRDGNRKKMSEIANLLGVSAGTPTVTVDRLIKKGFVVRDRDEEDRRQVIVKLSEKGLASFKEIVILKNTLMERLFNVIEPDQLKALVSMLHVLNEKFDEVFTEPLK